MKVSERPRNEDCNLKESEPCKIGAQEVLPFVIIGLLLLLPILLESLLGLFISDTQSHLKAQIVFVVEMLIIIGTIIFKTFRNFG